MKGQFLLSEAQKADKEAHASKPGWHRSIASSSKWGDVALFQCGPDQNMKVLPTSKGEMEKRRISVWTVGHSTRPVNEFIRLLQAQGIEQLVDVRTIPRSRHNPQFNQDQLSESLKEFGIRYLHIPGLGGLRRPRSDSINTAWKNASFRGYADYMQTREFGVALSQLIKLARHHRTAIMCAEAVPWRCHRSLIADALVVHGADVKEIASETKVRPHTLTPWSCVVGERITYPSAQIHSDANGGESDTQDPPIKS